MVSWIALGLSIIAIGWHVYEWAKRRSAKPEVAQWNTFYAYSDPGGKDTRTKIRLIFRNLSPRPTAILSVFVRSEGGGIIGGRGYRDRINLPIKLGPWDVEWRDFRIDKKDEEKMVDILVRDMEENKIIVKRQSGKQWHETLRSEGKVGS